jgi:hypothetical protein
MGTESFVRNAIGGFFDFLGRLSGSTAELLEELVLSDVCIIPLCLDLIAMTLSLMHFFTSFLIVFFLDAHQ